MKEFIEKLIERLEETDFNDIQMVVREVLLKYGFPYESIVQDEVWDDLDELSSNKFAIKIVNELTEEYINTSTDTSTGWISVKDGLPSDEKEYLVTLRDGEVTSAKYDKEEKIWVDTIEEYYEYPVIAWQPLPAPYKEGVTENE